ncbi:hypothetical protein ACNPM4_14825 [Microbacterium sp. AGC62]
MVAVTLVAVIVAGIALRFSHKSNQIAQAVYADDVRARNEAQARLVYASTRGASIYRKGENIPHHDGEHSMTQVGGNVLGCSSGSPGGFHAIEDMQIIDLEIFNGSTEVIGAFQAQLYDLQKQEIVPGSIGADYVRPGEKTPLIRIALPGMSAHYVSEISFRDSAGLSWSRRGYEPVQPLDEGRRALFDSLDRLRGGRA